MMVRILLKKQLLEIFRNYFNDRRKNRARSVGGTVFLFILFGVMISYLIGMTLVFSFSLCPALVSSGQGWMYFAIMGTVALTFGVFGSVFNTYATLYRAKDNDTLLSLPIPVNAILTSRMAVVFLLGTLYSSVVLLPAIAVWFVFSGFGASGVFGCLSFYLTVIFCVFVLSCALGWVVAKIAGKLKNKSFATVAVSLLFFAAYYVFIFRGRVLFSDIAKNASSYAGRARSVAPLYFFGRMGEGHPLEAAVCLLVTAALVFLTWFVLNRSFLGIVTATTPVKSKEWRSEKDKVRGAGSAFFRKEAAKFTSDPLYMLNCGLGSLVLVLATVAVIVFRPRILGAFASAPEFITGAIPAFLIGALIFAFSMNSTAAPSFSLEGVNIWIPQSLPVDPWVIIRSKLLFQIAITGVPAIPAAIAVSTLVGDDVPAAVGVAVSSLLTVVTIALWDTFWGLRLAKLSWTRESIPIKQSMPSFLSLFGAWVLAGTVISLYFPLGAFLGRIPYFIAVTVLNVGISTPLFVWLRKRGGAKFASLEK